MSGKEKYYKFRFRKIKYFFFLKIIFIFFLTKTYAFAEIKQKLIKKLENTQTLTFNFNQKISDKIQTGNCIIKYPRLIRCDYEDSYNKRLISNGKTLAIIQRRYKKIFLYPLKTTPLYHILDKEYLIEFIKNNEPKSIDNLLIKFEILENDKKFSIFFEEKSFDLRGWKTEDVYKNDVEFLIKNLKINIPTNQKLFKIPSQDDL